MPAGPTDTIVAWQSEGLANEKMRTPTTSNNSLSPKLKWHNSKMRVEFKGSFLNKVTFTTSIVVNLFIVTNFIIKDCLFGAVKLTKNSDPDKYSYSGFDIGFDSRFSSILNSWGKNVTIFGVDNSSSVLDDNKKQNI